MKFWKAVGGVLVFLGFLTALAGILATVAPMIDNEQVRRIIDSFSVHTLDPMVNAINMAILFCLRNNTLLFAIGAAALLVGGLLRAAAGKALAADAYPVRQAERAPTVREPARPPRPAAPAPAPLPVNAPAPAPKRDQSLSPFAAAAYGQALTGGAASDIAAKYMPRSIIDTPVGDDRLPVPDTRQGISEPPDGNQPEGSQPDGNATQQGKADWKTIETVYCSVCGAGSSWMAAFCDQCGNRLTLPDTLLANLAKDKPSPRAKMVTEILSRYQSEMEELTLADAKPPLSADGAGLAAQPPVWNAEQRQAAATAAPQGAPVADEYAQGSLNPARDVSRSIAADGHAAAEPSAAREQTSQRLTETVPQRFTETVPQQMGYGQPPSIEPPYPAGTAGAASHTRIVSTVRRVITAPTPLGGVMQPRETAPVRARPRIVSTIGKKRTD